MHCLNSDGWRVNGYLPIPKFSLLFHRRLRQLRHASRPRHVWRGRWRRAAPRARPQHGRPSPHRAPGHPPWQRSLGLAPSSSLQPPPAAGRGSEPRSLPPGATVKLAPSPARPGGSGGHGWGCKWGSVAPPRARASVSRSKRQRQLRFLSTGDVTARSRGSVLEWRSRVRIGE